MTFSFFAMTDILLFAYIGEPILLIFQFSVIGNDPITPNNMKWWFHFFFFIFQRKQNSVHSLWNTNDDRYLDVYFTNEDRYLDVCFTNEDRYMFT